MAGLDGTDGISDTGHGPPSSTFEFSYGGVQLLRETPALADYIAKCHPLRDIFGAAYPDSGWMASSDEQQQGYELNTLYWPTGCTRWAFGVFLVSDREIDALATAANSVPVAQLKMGNPDDPDHYIEASMFPLNPVPITGNSDASEAQGQALYLLPLVDARFQAQNYISPAGLDGGQIQVGDTVSMAGVLQQANSAVGGGAIPFDIDALPDYSTYADAKSLAYSVPSNYSSGMQAANAAAWSLGLTLVMELDGTGGFMHRDAATGQATNASRLNQLNAKIEDGTFRITAGFVNGSKDQANIDDLMKASIPDSLRLYVAPAADEVDESFPIAGVKEFQVLSSEVIGIQGDAQSWWVISPIIRDVDRDPDGAPSGTGTTEDDNKCEQLAFDLANEWYNQIANPIDVTFADICNVPLSSHTDIVEWHFGRRGTQTRVRSRRWNAFPNRLINQFKSPVEDNHAPHRWEKVTVKAGESGVRWNGKDYDAVWPIVQDGFTQFDEGDSVNAGWEPIQRKFWVADQRPLDFDYISQQVANWLTDNGYLDDTGGAGGDVDGGVVTP